MKSLFIMKFAAMNTKYIYNRFFLIRFETSIDLHRNIVDEILKLVLTTWVTSSIDDESHFAWQKKTFVLNSPNQVIFSIYHLFGWNDRRDGEKAQS